MSDAEVLRRAAATIRSRFLPALLLADALLEGAS